MRACPAVLPGSELAALAQPTAAQPDVLRARRPSRPDRTFHAALPLLKRQHPATGVIIVASTLDPALMLEAMRAGVDRVRGRAADGRRISRRPSAALVAQRPARPRWPARSSRSSAPRAASARRPSPSTSRPRSRSCQRTALLDRPAPRPTATPPSSSAPSRASRWSTRSRTPTASTRRSSRAWSSRPSAGLDLLASVRPGRRRAAGRAADSRR